VRSITVLRAVTGIQQRELAERAGVTNSHLSRVEAGHERPSPDLLYRLIGVLDDALKAPAKGGGDA
jgi:transcriptional regulator with XRE-family HTH domain